MTGEVRRIGAAVAREVRERHAADLAAEGPRPLVRELPPGAPFPIEALPSPLVDAAKAIEEVAQAPAALCAQSVLAAAAIATQGRCDVLLPTRARRPLSLFFLSVAASGERKSTADDLAMRPIRTRERELTREHGVAKTRYEVDFTIHEQERKQTLANKELNENGRKAALLALGPPPSPPTAPIFTCPEPTIEGLVKYLAVAPPSFGLFTSEGGQFIGSYAMTDEMKLRTASTLSSLWDGAPVRRLRAGEVIVITGRRLCMHLMAQPDVAASLLGDRVLLDQGLMSRLLVVAPPSAMGTRFWRAPSPGAWTVLEHYETVLLERLRGLSEPSPDGPALAVSLAAKATALWVRYADAVEGRLAEDGQYRPIAGLANKLAEHAARLAAVFAVLRDPLAGEITGEEMARGIELAEHYAAEASRLFEVGNVPEILIEARRVLEWLHDHWPHPSVGLPEIYQRGPQQVRTARGARRAVEILEEHGWLIPLPDGAEIDGVKRREAWKIVRPGGEQ